MDRFNKLLGRKSDEVDEGAGGKTDSPAPDRSAQGAGVSENGEFGLKFVFDSGESQMFSRLPITIGRAEDNDLILNDDSVSVHHAVVLFDERAKDICILDLDSLNGVWVSDQPTHKNVLQDGARITLGRVHLIYRDTGYIHPA